MTNPFRIDGPAVVSFSGGRTSGLMLYRILDAWGGQLPRDVTVAFANTGREMPATLDFVRECSERWSVPIVWLERAAGPHERTTPHTDRFRVVSFETAARNGEPLAQLFVERRGLPNPRQRGCTQETKIRVMRDFMRAQGHDYWTNIIGLRADERHRVASAKANAESERWETECPLCTAGIVKSDVLAFWQTQPFDLGLRGEWEGNCDGCYLKRLASKVRIAEDYPDRWAWWIAQESAAAERLGPSSTGARFRLDHPNTATIARMASQRRLPIFDPDDNDAIPCACTD